MRNNPSGRKPSARLALEAFIRHILDWGHYYEQGRRSAEIALRTQQVALSELDDDDPARVTLGQMYIRYFVCLEAYERIGGELTELAAIARARVGAKPLTERQALQKLRMVIDLMSTGMLQFAEDQLAAKRAHLKAHGSEAGAEVPIDLKDDYLSILRSETSQREVAYEHVVTNVAPVVLRFSEMFPRKE